MNNKLSPSIETESGLPDHQLPRIITAGSDDTGKRTLINRLLAECRSAAKHRPRFILSVTPDNAEHAPELFAGATTADVSEHTPGLLAGATTADATEHTPGLLAGATTADAILLLADAVKGITEQTKRLTYIASLLKIPHVILAINKMDLVGFSEEEYNRIKQEYGEIGSLLAIPNIHCIPVSGQNGDNVADASENTPWYSGNTLVEILEGIPVHPTGNDLPARFPVRQVIPSKDENPWESSAFAGKLSSGILKVGDSLLVIPGNRVANIKTLYEGGKQLQQAYANQSISIQLTNNLRIEKGSMFVKLNEKFPKYSSKVTLIVCWLNRNALKTDARYIVRHTTDETTAVVESIRYKVNIRTLENSTEDKNVALNDIAHITIKAEKPFKYDDYSENPTTGSLLFIDESTLETVGAGLIVSDPEVYSYNI